MAVMNCSCDHQSQDKIHGKGKRVFNKTMGGFRCTVCASEKSDTGTITKKKK